MTQHSDDPAPGSVVHADRRDPAAPDGPLALERARRELLEQAAASSSGRSARTLTPGDGAQLSQTLLALRAGRSLREHTAPGPATLLVLTGSGALTVGDRRIELRDGDWAQIPDEQHGLHADTDLVALLTVVTSPA